MLFPVYKNVRKLLLGGTNWRHYSAPDSCEIIRGAGVEFPVNISH